MTDQAIIDRILAGDDEAFGQLVERHHERCVRIARRILGNREDAEEAVQDAFLRAYRALASYEERERFAAWLTRILVNQCRSLRATTTRREQLFSELELDDARFGNYSAQESDAWPELDHVLAQLPVEQREALVLRYADDLTYDEMSRITGAGTSALKMRVQRAFTRLRALLGEVASV
jgi:RNA polymerase sigma-70 factor (ECF subfamily)